MVRPGAVYGPGNEWDHGAAPRVGRFALVAAAGARMRLTYVTNCADALVAALVACEVPRVAPSTWSTTTRRRTSSSSGPAGGPEPRTPAASWCRGGPSGPSAGRSTWSTSAPVRRACPPAGDRRPPSPDRQVAAAHLSKRCRTRGPRLETVRRPRRRRRRYDRRTTTVTSGTVPIGSVVVRGTWERDDTARERVLGS